MVMEFIITKVPAFKPREPNFLDGVRLDFEEGWMLIRASGTELAIRFMAKSVRESASQALLSKGIRLMEEVVKGVRNQNFDS